MPPIVWRAVRWNRRKADGRLMARKTTFYYAFLVLPREQRRAIVAVWDFCRAVDDAVDEATSGSREAIACWRAELARCYEGGMPETPQGRQLQPFITALDLPRRAFDDVIDGVAMDLDTTRYETFDDLFEYCRRVASAVGMICIRIFGCQSPRGHRLRVEPRGGAPAHQHHPGRQRRPRQGARLFSARRSRGRQLHARRSRGQGTVCRSRFAAFSSSSAGARGSFTGAPSRRVPKRIAHASPRPRSCARSTSPRCGAWSRTATTCSPAACGCDVPSRRRSR